MKNLVVFLATVTNSIFLSVLLLYYSLLLQLSILFLQDPPSFLHSASAEEFLHQFSFQPEFTEK
jgi:hypothetical protein